MKIIKLLFLGIGFLGLIFTAGCGGDNGVETELLKASGTISATSVNISSEVGGVVDEVYVSEGQQIDAGDLLFSVDDEIYLAQYSQAEAAVKAAQASVEAAKAQLTSAEIQLELAFQGARLTEMQERNSAWFFPNPIQVELPEWYFSKLDQINAVYEIIAEAQLNLERREDYLAEILVDSSKEDFTQLEGRLADAQISFMIAAQALELTRAAQSNDELLEAADEEYSAALAELEDVQQDYNRLLSSTAAQEVLEARAQVAVSKLLYEKAQDQLLFLLSGDESLQVKAAQAGVKQAEAAVLQAEANLNQANSSLAVLGIQIEKTQIAAPISGNVLVQNLNTGELVGPGGTVMRVGNIDEVNLLVYVPEDRYGKIRLNQEVVVTVDTFPDKSYLGYVTFISDQAEFTPSNVQTVEGRKATVYAVEIKIGNYNHDLKPGMPADVVFLE